MRWPRRVLLATVVVATSCSASSDDPSSAGRSPTASSTASTTVSTTPATAAVTAETSPVDDENSATQWPDLIDPTCDALGSAGYESRKTALRDFEAAAGDDVAGVEQLARACGPELDRLVAAIELEARRDDLDRGDAPITISDLRCADGVYQFIATNETDHPIGVHGGFRVLVGDSDEPASSADYPIVIWELGPGDRQGITGEFHEPESDAGYRCNLSARAFDAADDDADAAVPGSIVDALTGDEPEAWFGALLGREVDAVGSGDVDAAALTEDLRSTFYDNVLASNTGEAPIDRIPTSVKICRDSVDRPDDDRVSFVYYVTYPTPDGGEEGLLRHGLFRRGSDGQWRWLSAAQYFDSPDFWSCGRPGPVG